MTRFFLALLLFALTVSAWAVDLTVKPYKPSATVLEYQAALDQAKSAADEMDIARKFQTKYPDDVDVQMQISNMLAMEDINAARKVYNERAQAEPQNPVALYLAGRLAEGFPERRANAEKILALDSENYWGNLLMGGVYADGEAQDLTKAETYFRKAITINPAQPNAVAGLGDVYVKRGDTAGADEIYQKLATMQPDKFQPVQMRLALYAGNVDKQFAIVEEFLQRNPRNVSALYTRGAALREKQDWNGYVESMQRAVASEKTGDNCYNLACAFALAGNVDSSFAYLESASDLGFNDAAQYKQDEDLIPLRNDPRWSALLNRIDANEQKELQAFMKEMEKSAPQRQKAAVESRGSSPAPDWTVQDLNGQEVKLSSLRGKVVVIDFWATWCGPCRKTMPLIEQFYEKKAKDVEVYGMNVWERGSNAGVKPFIEKAGFKFPILLGDGNIAEEYGVQGIPTMVIIDKQGNVAYRHVGYNPTLVETLTWQTDELLKK